MDLSFIIGPVVGGIIGLITNGIAIRMLFRPLKPIIIFGMKLPFTPGLIPKEKNRIANSLGDVVGNTLVNEEVLKGGLLSTEMDEKIKTSLGTFIDNQRTSEKSLKELLGIVTGDHQNTELIKKGKDKMTTAAYERLQTFDLGESLSEMAVEEILINLEGSMFSMFINDSLIAMVKGKISEVIDQLVINRGEEIIGSMVGKEIDHLMDIQVKDLISEYEDKIPDLIERIIETYHRLVNENLGKVITTLNISKLVEDQINGFDVLEFEKIILNIMSKELRAIVWLGGLLGCLMGIVMSIF